MFPNAVRALPKCFDLLPAVHGELVLEVGLFKVIANLGESAQGGTGDGVARRSLFDGAFGGGHKSSS